MSEKKSYAEINEKIVRGEAVVLTAEEVSEMGKTLSAKEIARKVDVVTTATFGPMCSSGMFINVGHSRPPIRMERATLNGVPVFTGIAAVDLYIGATETHPDDPSYGGAHIIEALIGGEDVELIAHGKGTDCYPLRDIRTKINRSNINEMIMFNPRNAYQNYPAAANSSSRIKYTYMGSLLPNLGNVNYSTSGELSPLLNDPELRTIGIGTRIFLGGARGYVSWTGTQFKTRGIRNQYGIPEFNAATLAVTGDARQMNTEFIKAAYFERYGVSIFIGIGVPIPVLDADIAERVMIRNEQITTRILDYSNPDHPELAATNYAELFSGEITLKGRKVKTASMSSLYKARIIAGLLKEQIKKGQFTLTEPVSLFPRDTSLHSLEIR
ncbi:MAG: homocysteine biosynthesis protein [Bacteroidales bacterium]|nr:homocysteine biosynthesis protein [Bacteroidales bacterium]MBN2697386.1 homocysteine biosynthesis protein [Bacteroidales bacterium]